jgi:hypothetical protein
MTARMFGVPFVPIPYRSIGIGLVLVRMVLRTMETQRLPSTAVSNRATIQEISYAVLNSYLERLL